MGITSAGRLAATAFALVAASSLAACSSSGATSAATSAPAAPAGSTAPAASATPAATAAAPTVAATPWPSVVALPTTLPASMTFEQSLPLFAYDGAKPLEMQVVSSEDADAFTTKDITYKGAAGETIEAYLILPKGDGPFPAVLYEHGSGGNRDVFNAEAGLIAKQHKIAGLVISRPTGLDNGGGDTTEMILQIREMRRSLDLLAAQPQIDATRLGYLGHSQGANYGSILLSVEPRLKTGVLMAAVPGAPAQNIAAGHIAKPSVFLQFGKQDGYYTTETAEAFAALIPATHKVSWYDAGHSLNETAMADRAAWLADKLGAK